LFTTGIHMLCLNVTRGYGSLSVQGYRGAPCSAFVPVFSPACSLGLSSPPPCLAACFTEAIFVDDSLLIDRDGGAFAWAAVRREPSSSTDSSPRCRRIPSSGLHGSPFRRAARPQTNTKTPTPQVRLLAHGGAGRGGRLGHALVQGSAAARCRSPPSEDARHVPREVVSLFNYGAGLQGCQFRLQK